MKTTSLESTTNPSKNLHIVLWVLQVLLAGFFIMVGFMKLTTPIAAIGAQMPWVLEYSPFLIRFIGLSQVLGGIGLIIPAATRIKPFLTTWAAFGLSLIMILAALFHLSRGEYSGIIMPLVIAAIAYFIGWARYKKVPITAR